MNSADKKRVALVVGGSGGIGVALVTRLLADGFFVCATYAHEGQKIKILKDEFVGKAVSFFKMDLLQEGNVSLVIKEIRQAHPRIDVIVFSPTLPQLYKPLMECKWSDFEGHIMVQVRGMAEIISQLREQILSKYRTKFIIILTEACIGKPPARMAPYVTAKYALLGLVKTMVAEFSGYNCTVNAISPGMVQTGLHSTSPSKLIELAAYSNPLKRIATPGDIANVVSFLAVEQSDYLNGINILVNGGSTIL